jgi:AraC-like DNA-binding protein
MRLTNEALQINDILLAMGLGWALAGMILLLLFKEKRKEPSTPYAILVLGVLSLTIADNMLHTPVGHDPKTTFFMMLCRPSYFLVGPALWFYVGSLLGRDHPSRPTRLFHFVPYLLGVTFFALHPETLEPVRFSTPEGINFNTALTNLSIIVYSTALSRIVGKHRKAVSDSYSTNNTKTTLSWLQYLTILYLSLSLYKLVMESFFPTFLRYNILVSALRYTPSVLFVFGFLIFSKNQDNLPEPATEPAVSADNRKYCKSGMSEAEEKRLYDALIRHIEEKKPYLDPELTLSELAEQMGETRHRLSEVINRKAGKNFYGFINDFRLEATKEALETDRFPEYTILAIANEFGFKSSSVFYSLFKKKYGQTPKEIVRQKDKAAETSERTSVS